MKTVDSNDLEVDACNYASLDGKPFTGTAVEKWPDGSMRAVEHYVNGMTHGEAREWSRSGQLLVEENHHHGGPQGLSRYWHENGQLKGERFVQYRVVIWEKEWDEAGNLIKDWQLTPDSPNYEIFVLGRDAALARQKPPR